MASQRHETGKVVVLLADDDRFMCSLIGNAIRNSPRYEVVFAGTGREAIECLFSTQPAIDIALLDFIMPEGNGLEVARRIRTGGTGAARDLPIAMLTGQRDHRSVRAAMELDINAYVVKPVTKEGLFSRLDRARAIPFELKDPEVYKRVVIPDPFGYDRPKAAPLPLPVPPCAAEPEPSIVRIEKRVSELVPGDILGKSVRDNASANIVVPAHIQLDRALIARLSDLADMGMIPSTVFVIHKQGA
ncbi:MAG TPA: response regulator [Azospirillum sp.]|nr:response regulator [Azospirillum sp.]